MQAIRIENKLSDSHRDAVKDRISAVNRSTSVCELRNEISHLLYVKKHLEKSMTFLWDIIH